MICQTVFWMLEDTLVCKIENKTKQNSTTVGLDLLEKLDKKYIHSLYIKLDCDKCLEIQKERKLFKNLQYFLYADN